VNPRYARIIFILIAALVVTSIVLSSLPNPGR
jgi:hypothetical protein